MKTLNLVCLILVGATNIYAQKDTTQRNLKNKIAIEFGYNQVYLKDHVFSPLNYTGGGSLISLNYQRNSNELKNMIFVDFNLISTGLKTNASDLLSSHQYIGNFEIGYLRNTRISIMPKIELFIGTSYISEIGYLDWFSESRSYFATHGLTAKTLLLYQPKPKHLIQTTLSIPIFQLMVRPPYNGFNKETEELFDRSIIRLVFKGKFASFNQYFGLFWKTSYTFQLSRRWDLDFAYSLNYRRTYEENHLIQFNNILSSSIHFKF